MLTDLPQVITTCVVASFTEKKLHPEKQALIPTILMDQNQFRVCLYNCEKDVESGCSAHCCDPQWDSPNQPTNSSFLAATRRVQGSGKSKQMRSVQTGWFKQYPWLSLCETRQRLFCFYCQCAERRKLVNFSTKGEDTFSTTGFVIGKRLGKDFVSMKEVKYMLNRA